MDARTLQVASRLTSRERLLFARSQGYDAPLAGPDAQIEALARAVDTLTVEGVPHALIGGLAVGLVSGVPRATLDVALAIPSGSDRARIIAAMTDAGFELIGGYPHSINFRYVSGEPVQLALDPQFDPMIQRADRLMVADRELCIVTRDDLIAMKERASKDPHRRRSKALRDQADVELLRGDVPGPDEGW